MSEQASAEDGFTAAFRDHYPAVLAFARRRIGDHFAEDVAADVFTIAWRRWTDAPPDVRPWLFGIAKNVMSGAGRSERRRERLNMKASLQPPAEVPDLGDDVAAAVDLRVAWSELSEADREVIALVAWDGLASAQAAEVLAISRIAYVARLSRARKRLRRRLADRGKRSQAASEGDRRQARAWATTFAEPTTSPMTPSGGETR
jgi:RNA polymerase sigma-70 factor (ECF subfamily)